MPTWTQDELDDVNAAIASGVTRVTHNGTTTEYRSLADLMRLRDEMAAGLAAAGTIKVRRLRIITTKGLGT
jgi:hypothetical protein